MSELRKDPIVGRWVIVAIERAKRPNDFLSKKPEVHSSNKFNQSLPEESSYPGKQYKIYPENTEIALDRPEETFKTKESFGFHRIVKDNYPLGLNKNCDFYPTFSRYKKEILEIKKNERIKYITIFRNYQVKTNSGSTRHNHSNFIGLSVYSKNGKREINGSLDYYKDKKSCIYCDIISQEQNFKKRFILENDNFIAISPFASRFPLESWILPKKHSCDYSESSQSQLKSLSKAFKEVMLRMKKLLGAFSYTYVLHTAPLDIQRGSELFSGYHWYIEIIPLLTRVAGFEWGTGFYINPTPPESAAQYLKKIKLEEKIA
jgi:UDPglucose--hexose-1-phosphate uridylyltransferase